MDTTVDGQFDDAAPRAGLGFSRPDSATTTASNRDDVTLRDHRAGMTPAAKPRLDEFGRVIPSSSANRSSMDHRINHDARERNRDDSEDAARSGIVRRISVADLDSFQ
jgi:hypothetical protein